MKRIIALGVIIFGLNACQNITHTPNETPAQISPTMSQQNLKKVWHFSHFPAFQKTPMTRGSMDWSELPSASADMGCNTLRFQVQLHESGSLKVDAVSATRMYCAEAMPLEQAFIKHIKEMTHYHVEGKTLILRNDAGAEMRFTTP